MTSEERLNHIKNMAICFLYLDIEETSLSPAFINHPFFNSGYSAYVKDGETVPINIMESDENLELVRKYVENNIKSCNSISRIFMMFQKSYRLTFLKYVKKYLTKKEFAEQLKDVWIMSENPNNDVNVSIGTLVRWFQSADKKYLMNEEEYEIYENLPDQVRVYCGVNKFENPKGLSWTLSLDTAKWFANRWSHDGSEDGYIQTALVNKSDVLAYFGDRGESEVIIDGRKLDAEILEV